MDYILWELPELVIDKKFNSNINYETGEIQFNWFGEGNKIKDIPLLYKDNGQSVTEVNVWLIDLKASYNRKKVNTQAQALLHYYIFLDQIGMRWDEMPIAKRNKPTYKFRNYLIESVKSKNLARTTANNYLGCVVNFYKYYISKHYPFENKPFNYEEIPIMIGSNHEYMRKRKIYVTSTDLRLKLPKDKYNYGVSRKLIPLSRVEWDMVDSLCREKHKNLNLSIEFKLMLYLARYTGMRREEIVTFRTKLIYKVFSEQLKKKYLVNSDAPFIGPELGINTKGSGSRNIEIPSKLMNELYHYINSPRYLSRKIKFIKKHPEEKDNPLLFITERGHKYSGGSINARWGEIRKNIQKTKPQFEHKFHNLRSTYAVFRLEELLNKGVTESKSLDYLQFVMGHKSRSTLLHYLKFCNKEDSANELYENIIIKLLEE